MKSTAQKSILWSLASRGLIYVFILLQGMMIARLVGPEGKGIQAKLMATISLFVFFMDFGLSNSINYFLSQKKISLYDTKKLLKFVFFAQFIISLLIFVCFKIGFVQTFFLPLNRISFYFTVYIALSAFFDVTRLSLNSFLMANLKFKWVNWIEIFQALLRLVCNILIFIFVEREPIQVLNYVLAVEIFSSALFFIATSCLIYYLKDQDSKPKFESSERLNFLFFKTQILTYSIPLFMSNIAIFFNTRMDYIAIEKLLGLEKLGYYSVASSGAQMMTIIPTVVGSIIFTYMNQLEGAKKIDFFSFYSRLNFTILLATSLLLFVLAPFIIPVLFGPRFDQSIGLYQWLLLVTLLQSYKYLLGIFLQSVHKNKLRLKSDFVSLIVNAILLCPALVFGGLYGSITLLFIGQIVSICYIHLKITDENLRFTKLLILRREELKQISY